MIDFTKILLYPSYYDSLISHELLTYEPKNVGANGEVIIGKNGKEKMPFYYAEYKDLQFILYTNKRVIIQGSFHKLYNNGLHNFNDFGIVALAETLKWFLDTFKIEPEDARILILEYGLNILPPCATELILNYFYFHRKEPFERTATTTEGHYLQVKHDNYRLKIYDKQKQYKSRYLLPDDILRIEQNTKGVYLRKKFNITTLHDLMHFDQSLLLNDLIEQVSTSLFYDFTIKHDSKRLLNYKDRNYWSALIREKKNSSYDKHRNLLNQYIKYYSDNVMQQITKKLESKFHELYKEGMVIQPIIDNRKNTPLERRCKVTGYNISMQKTNSFFLSTTGIRHYKENYPEVYKHLKEIFLCIAWHLEEEAIQIKEIAHNIRNKYHNNKGKNYNQIRLPFYEDTLKKFN